MENFTFNGDCSCRESSTRAQDAERAQLELKIGGNGIELKMGNELKMGSELKMHQWRYGMTTRLAMEIEAEK